MDVNTMYAAADLGLQDEYDTQIVKNVWNDSSSFANFTAKDFEGETNMCEGVYEKQGAEGYSKCYNAAISSNTPEHNALALKYAKALEKGYSKDFESFKKKTGTLSSIGDIATGLLGGLLDNFASGNKDGNIQVGGYEYAPQPKSRTGLYVGIGLVAVLGIGTAIYFATRKK